MIREGNVEDFKVAVVGVGRWDAGVTRMEDEADASSKKGEALVDIFEGCVGRAHLLDSGRGKDAAYRRDIDAGFFDGVIWQDGG